MGVILIIFSRGGEKREYGKMNRKDDDSDNEVITHLERVKIPAIEQMLESAKNQLLRLRQKQPHPCANANGCEPPKDGKTR